MSDEQAVTLRHNLDPDAFTWLWMKYVRGLNNRHHCTNCLRGWYGKRGLHQPLHGCPVAPADDPGAEAGEQGGQDQDGEDLAGQHRAYPLRQTVACRPLT